MAEDEVEVTVSVPATPEPAEVTPEVNPVTVVETGNADDAITATVIEHEGEISALESDVDEAQATADAAAATAEDAQTAAAMAAEAAVESVAAVAEMIAEAEPESTPDDDIAPNREHWFWR